ncbi:hypothetical protein B2J93_8059 [Marssonina coronariae]|uniref:Uncharacterized protein n=1 Tax=Diplocarpon coronariae TaxID=2795749 RepID=A0A218ZBB0_9HELO|nr:hypothetical protein B2J93_8059 [Marssonina coronariae]
MAGHEMLDSTSRVELEIERGAAVIADTSARAIEPQKGAKLRNNQGPSRAERRAAKRASRREDTKALHGSMEKKQQRLKELRAGPPHDAAELMDAESKLAAEARTLETSLERVRRGGVGMHGRVEELDDAAAPVAEELDDAERESGKDGLHLRGSRGKGSRRDAKSRNSDGFSLEEKLEHLQGSVDRRNKRLENLESQYPLRAGGSKKMKKKLRRPTREFDGFRHDLGLESTEIIDSQIGEHEGSGDEEITGSPVPKKEDPMAESRIQDQQLGRIKLSSEERTRRKKANKRKAVDGVEDAVSAGEAPAGEFAVGEAIVVDEISVKEKKRRKKDKGPQDPVKIRSIPAFEAALGDEQPAPANQFSGHRKAVFNTRTGGYVMQNAQKAPPQPQQIKQDALLATMTDAGSPSARSPSADDRILEAVISDVMATKSPAERCYDALVAVGKAAAAAPYRRRTDPSPDHELAKQLSRSILSPPRIPAQEKHKETRILPPKRNYSFAREIAAGTKSPPPGKKSKGRRTRLSGEAEESAAMFQTAMALKEAASATAIGGLFPQDPLTWRASTRKRPRTLPSPIDPHSSTPETTPTKARRVHEGVRLSKSGRRERVEGEGDGWEVQSGRVRVGRRGRCPDEGEKEEKIAFSSTYLASRPRGVLVGNAKFQVLELVSGTEHELPTHTSKDGKASKICSVAKGRVQVTVGGQDFDMGEGGMFRVGAGEKCVVISQGSSQGDAVVHVCTTGG